MIKTACLGFPRIGANRELKKALESYWAKQSPLDNLLSVAKAIRKQHWQWQLAANIDFIPSNDFSLYDHVLDTMFLLGAIPERYRQIENEIERYFTMARGNKNIPAMEMSKWFDTNYHYIVPEFTKNQTFQLSNKGIFSNKVFDEFTEAIQYGVNTHPVLIGPVSFLLLGKCEKEKFNQLDLLENLLPVYIELFKNLKKIGCDWLQIDEPFLGMDLTSEQKKMFKNAYQKINESKHGCRLLLTTYFSSVEENLDCLPDVDGLHLDLISDAAQLEKIKNDWHKEKTLSLGLIDGRNVWKNNYEQSLALINKAKCITDNLVITTSSSLLHCPIDLDTEQSINDEVRSWFAFAKQKLNECCELKQIVNDNKTELFEKNKLIITSKKHSSLVSSKRVQERLKKIPGLLKEKRLAYSARHKQQQEHCHLPLMPTTTIGSLPQTSEIRKIRREFRQGKINQDKYDIFIKNKIEGAIKLQEQIGLDVLVHGEFERADMVEYFAENLTGFLLTDNGWVQSYGSRCVKPPIIYGDVDREKSITTNTITYAQSCSDKPIKAILTGPVTIAQWSFVRDDQPREHTCQQIALALRDEILDLEKNNINIIQIDEAAFREALPLRQKDWSHYLTWSVGCFQLCIAGIKDTTQIHTHMCYSKFNDIISAIAKLDADVLYIETSRSNMALLKSFEQFHYPNSIGPGVYDIHSPRVPSVDEIKNLIHSAEKVIDYHQLWINPDCGLKTRNWDETKAALANMVKAAEDCRRELGEK